MARGAALLAVRRGTGTGRAAAIPAMTTTAASTNMLARPSGSFQLPMSSVALRQAGGAAEDEAGEGAGGEAGRGEEERRASG